MKNKNIQGKLTLAFAIATFLVLGGFILHQISDAAERRQTLEMQRETSLKHIYDDVAQTYLIFKNFASRWNGNYAELTTNHTRDTRVHPRYTVREFGRKHQKIITQLDNLNRQLKIWNPIEMDYIIKANDLDYDIKHLVHTYRLRDEFFALTQDLEHAFSTIVHHQAAKDTVRTGTMEREPHYSVYFRTLQRLDFLYMELMLSRYPKDLKYLTNTSPKFVALAKRSVFADQVAELLERHDIERDTADYGFQKNADICEVANENLTTYVVKRNSGKILSLIMSDTDLTNTPHDETQRLLRALAQCTAQFKTTVEEGRYYYINTTNGSYFSKNMAQGFKLIDNENMSTLLTFYDDENQEYYISGDYDAFKVFYPNEVKTPE